MRSIAVQRGFTLIELMIVVVLLGITAAIALPNFGRMIDNNQHAAAANDFSGLLQFARSEAIRRGNRVVVFSSGNSNSGYGVCLEPDLNACKTNPQKADGLLRTSNELPGSITITQTKKPSGAPEELTFRGSGMVPGGGYEFRICGKSGTEAAVISVNAGGQIRLNSNTNVTCS